MAGDRYSELGPIFGQRTVGVGGCLLDSVTGQPCAFAAGHFPMLAVVCGVYKVQRSGRWNTAQLPWVLRMCSPGSCGPWSLRRELCAVKPCDAGPDCVPVWLSASTLSARGVLGGEELSGS